MENMHGTTICAVVKDNQFAMAGDGQVTLGNTVMKGNATKVRRIFDDKIIAGFAGATADAFTLLEKLEQKLQKYGGNLIRASVELAKDWRTDRILRRLEAMMIVGDENNIYIISGNGDVLEPENGIVAIGSGGNYALAAATALKKNTSLSAEEIAVRSLNIASDICIYTNENIVVEKLAFKGSPND